MSNAPLYKIVTNQQVQGPYYRLVLKDFPASQPGQFVNILCQPDDRFLLRRPFCINQVVGSETHILYKVIGPGTELLAKRQPGEQLDVIGPLGNGWELGKEEEVSSKEEGGVRHVLVGGGIGIAPLLFLAQALGASNTQAPSDLRASPPKRGEKSVGFVGNLEYNSPITVLLGGRTAEDILCKAEFEELGCDVQIATDDGSLGKNGLVTDLLISQITNHKSQITNQIYSCGPHPMLAAVAKIAKAQNIPCQVSLEAMMGCGLGGCVCCVCATKYGYEKVCSKGPVFMAEGVIW